MKLERTTIISTEDKQKALELFESVIVEKDVLIVVVLGNDDKRKSLVEEADVRARLDILGYEGRVIWIHDPKILNDEITKLKAGEKDISGKDLAAVVAFSVSPEKTVMGILEDKDKIDADTVEDLFLAAGS
jgi:hypothetical protein